MSERIETTAIRNLIHNEEYCRKVLPFIKEEYFVDRLEKLLFTEIYKFVNKYNQLPTKESLSIEINTNKGITEDEYKKLTGIISELTPEPINLDWLVETTETWCKDRAIHNAILGGIQIIDGKDKEHTPEYLPEMLSEALSVSFDQKVGHDYLLESKDVERSLPDDGESHENANSNVGVVCDVVVLPKEDVGVALLLQ